MQTWTVKELREALNNPKINEDWQVKISYPESPFGVKRVQDPHYDIGYDRNTKEVWLEL